MAHAVWLCKRHYMNKDVLSDRYGRLYHLPMQLSQGLSVSVFLLSYRFAKDQQSSVISSKSLSWSAHSFGIAGVGLFHWFYRLLKTIYREQSQWVIGSSDCFHVIVAWLLSKLTGTKLVIDLYDNYESFGMAKIPGMKYFYRRALRDASCISAVSVTLRDFIKENFNSCCMLLESTIDKSMFYAATERDIRLEAIKRDWPIVVGVGGGLNSEHDVETLFSAMEKLVSQRQEIHFVFAGVATKALLERCSSNIHYIGVIDNRRMRDFYLSMDVSIIAMADNQFGRFAFPQKAYEILACGVPAVSARVGALKKLFSGYERTLYTPQDVKSLIAAVEYQLENKKVPALEIPDWQEQGRRLTAFISGDRVA